MGIRLARTTGEKKARRIRRAIHLMVEISNFKKNPRTLYLYGLRIYFYYLYPLLYP
jgi:hypothetical protein